MDAAQPASGPGGPPPASDRTEPESPEALHRRASAEAANDGVLDGAKGLWRDFSAIAKDHLELALLETQRAGKSAVNMLIYAIGAALLLVTAWLGLLAAIVIGLAELGLHAGFGMLIVVAANLVGAYVLYRMIRSNSENLRFPATVRSFRNDAAALRAGIAKGADGAPAAATGHDSSTATTGAAAGASTAETRS